MKRTGRRCLRLELSIVRLLCLIRHLRWALLTNGLILERLQRDAGFQKFVKGDATIACVDGAWADSDIAALRRDAQALRAVGFGARAGVASKTSGIRNGVHQIWLQSPGESRSSAASERSSGGSVSTVFVGDQDARRKLLRSIDSLRELIQELCLRPTSSSGDSVRIPPHLVELSYLLYEGGGASYAKHIDCTAQDVSRGTRGDSRRLVSLLLYLGGDGYSGADGEWDAPFHGGALRIHGEPTETLVREPASSTPQPTTMDNTESLHSHSWSDLAPLPGRMVLFDSSAVWHEVLPTVTKRFAVVGWFRTPF